MSASIQITVTVPEIIISSAVVRLKIQNKLERKTGPDMMKLFKKTTQGWEHNINFYQKSKNTNNEVSVTVFTRFKQYVLVNFGSPPHTITAKRPSGLLRFQRGYKSSTRPGIISSRQKQRFGPIYETYFVEHPGFEAREFDKAIAEEIAETFAEDVQDAISLGSSIF